MEENNKLAGTLRIGHYPINSKTADHTYAIMDDHGKEIRFQCYGGTNDSGNKYPVNFWTPTFWERDSRKVGSSLPCHSYIARHLAAWDGHIDLNRTDYNRKSGGHSGLGDNAGIVYAVTGVCHQMCNVISCSTNLGDAKNAPVNWPASFNASRFFYGDRGSGNHVNNVQKFINSLINWYNQYNVSNADIQLTNDHVEILNNELIQINQLSDDDLKNRLHHGFSKEERLNLIKDNLSLLENDQNQNEINPILEYDLNIMDKKNELDNLILRDQISKKEYADKVNELCAALTSRYMDVVSSKNKNILFGENREDIITNIIDVNMMPESYEPLKVSLKL